MKSLKPNMKGLMMSSALRTAFVTTSTAMAIALTSAIPVQAQEITSSIRGSVRDADGTAVAGATVVVIHTPSGSRSTHTTNSKGAFFSRGLRPGGPYSVEVRYADGTGGQKIEGVSLQVSEPYPLSFTLKDVDTSALEEVVVTGQAISSPVQGGGSSTYGADEIAGAPSASRDFKDIIRFNPFVELDSTNSDAITIGGSNNRFNNLTVDGLRQSDDFGLNASGVPTQRTPVSIDAIEQVSVSPAPFGVENGRFTGGSINVVTKSGTNEYHGSIFYEYSDDGLIGDKSKDIDVPLGDFSEKFYGATIGGPIIKDKLFFFASYEKFEGSSPITRGTADSGAPNNTSRVTDADIAAVTEIAQRVYGFDTLGAAFGQTFNEEDEKYLIKIDWNINEDHRAFFSYQKTTGNQLQDADNSFSSIALLSHFYNRSEDLEAYNFQVFSDWSDNLSTEVKIGRKKNITGQVSLSEPGVADMEIRTAGGGSVFIGIDDSRHANQLNNTTWQAKFKADYLAGDHTITAGYELDSLDIFNLFLQDSLGDVRFGSIADFEAGTPNSYVYQNAISNNAEDAAAQFNITVHTFYLQDVWDVNEDLVITGGVRFDLYQQNERPLENQNFFDRNGFSNAETLDGISIIQPRFAFTYDVTETTKIRGGIGLFGGGNPNVWVSNSFSNDGQNISRFTDRDDASLLANFDPRNVPQVAKDGLIAGNGNVNALDPDFDLPSSWKFNLAVEHYANLGPLGDNWHFTAEAILSRIKNGANWTELRRTQIGTAADGSAIYDNPNGFDLLLTNTTEGKEDTYIFSFDKAWDNGFSVFGSYAYQDADTVNEGTSSTATSNFNFAAHLDRNNRVLGTSVFEVEHSVKFGATYRKAIWDDNYTTISLFYSGKSGRPYSLAFDEFLQFGGNRSIDSGDGHLLFIPEIGDPRVSFETPEDEVDFNALVDELGLKRGESLRAQSQRAPWVTNMDLRISQEIPFVYGKFEVFAAFENFLNLINSDSGRNIRANFAQIPVVDLEVLANGDFVFGQVEDPIEQLTLQAEQSVWKIQLGVKYKF